MARGQPSPPAAGAGYGPFVATVTLLAVAFAGLLAGLQLSYAPAPASFAVAIADREVRVRAAAPAPAAPAAEAAEADTDSELPVAEASASLALPEVLALLLPPLALPAAVRPSDRIMPAVTPAEPALPTPAGPARVAPVLAPLPPATMLPPRLAPPAPMAPLTHAAPALPRLPSAPDGVPVTLAAWRAPTPAPLPRLAAAPTPPTPPLPDPRPSARRLAALAPAAGPAVAARRPRIAIVLWGLGRSAEASAAAIRELPPAVTLSLTPHGRELQRWADRARAAGHEVLLELPMEPESYPTVNPGADALLTSLTEAENRRRLEHLLGLVDGELGVTNFMGSRFTVTEAPLRPVLALLKARGLAFLDSSASSHSIAYRLAGELGLDRAFNNRYIDNQASAAAIDGRLAELEQLAARHGAAVGIGTPDDLTRERLRRWIAGLDGKRLELAPLSAVLRRGGER